MHPELERLRKAVDWEAVSKKQNPRWIIVAIDNVAAGYATIPEDLKGVIEGYFTVYVIDAWQITHCCEITPSYWLEEVENALFQSYDTPEEDRDLLWEEWCLGQDDTSHYAHCRLVEAGGHGVVIQTFDYEAGDEEDDLKAMENVRAAYAGSPTLC